MRPSDKAGALRDYGLLDRDLWGLSELRGWFNKKAPATPPAASSARFAGGHTLRGPTPKTAPKPMSAKHGPRHTNRFTRPRTAVKLPPAGVVPGKVTQAPAHWIDHENNLRAQTKVRVRAGARGCAVSRAASHHGRRVTVRTIPSRASCSLSCVCGVHCAGGGTPPQVRQVAEQVPQAVERQAA